MRPVMLVGSLIVLLGLSTGCSISRAIKQPPPIPVEQAKVGSTRAEIISIFGPPKFSEQNGSDRTDVYKFIDGYHGATKMRVILYAAADVFTLGLAELILWPLEAAALDGKEGKAVATYDENHIVKKLVVTDTDGNPWEDPPESEEPSTGDE